MDIVQLKQMEPIFGAWHVEKEIGSGSFGKVYAIYKDDGGFRFRAALKVITIPTNNNDIQELDSQGFDHAAKVRYFDNISAGIMEEIRIMNTLRGFTNIVCFEDYQTIPHPDGIGRDILIRMELLESLDKHMERIRATQFDVVTMLRDIAQALVLCDQKNIIHRDIKPDNIMVSDSGDYKLVDFGIARNMERTSQASTKAGSYPYMAPEVQMHQPYGKSVDIYSLGVVAYRELNAYRYPFLPPYPRPFTAEERDMALYRRFRGDKIPPIPGVSRQLFSIIEKCIAHKPEHRYTNPQALLNDLNAVIKQPDLKKKRLYDDAGKLIPPHSGKEFNPQAGEGSFQGGSFRSGGSVSVNGGGSSVHGSSVNGSSINGSGIGGAPSMSIRAEKPKKKKTGLIVAIAILLAAAGAGAFFFLGGGKDAQKPHEAISISILREAEKAEHAENGTVGAQGSETIRIEGTASPDTELVLSCSGGTQTAQSDGEGHYSFAVDSQSLPIDRATEISVAYAKPQETDTQASIPVYRDGTCALSIDENESGADRITGKTDPWALVYGADADGTPAQADGEGIFTAINNSAESGSILSLYAEDPYGNRSETVEYSVPYRPVALSIDCTGKNGKQVITGKVEEIQLSGEGPDQEMIWVRAVSDKGVSLFDGMVSVNNGGWLVEHVNLGTLIGDGTLTLSAEWAGNAVQPGQTATNTVTYDRSCYLHFAPPPGNALTEDIHSLQGTTDSGSTVKLYSADGTLLASVTADESGSFTMNGLNLTAGDTPYGISTDVSGNDSQPYMLLQVQAGAESAAAAANAGEDRTPVTLRIEGADADACWKDNKVTLKGEAKPGEKLEARIGTLTMATFEAEGDGETGTYTAEIPLSNFASNEEQALSIQVRYADGIGQASEPVIIKYDTGISDPVLTEIVNDSAKVIRGRADAGDRVMLGEGTDKGIAGVIAEATADGEGNFAIQLEKPLEIGGNYLLYAQDRADHTSQFIPVKVTVTVREKIDVTVTQNGRTIQDGSRINRDRLEVELLRGETEYGITIEITGTESGTIYSIETEEGKQERNYYFEPFRVSEVFTDGETLELAVYYADWDKTRNPFTMNLIYDVTGEEPKLKTRGLTSEMSTVEGTAEPGSMVHLVVEGTDTVAEADVNGVFRFENVNLSVGEKCVLFAVDPLGNMSESKEYEVQAIAGIALTDGAENLEKGYVNGRENRMTLTGTAEPGKRIDIVLNNAPIAQDIEVSEEGEWTASVDFSSLQADTQNLLQLYYAGSLQAETEIPFLYDPACGDIEINGTVTEDTEIIRGRTEPKATVFLRTQDGEKGKTESDGEGEFRLELPAKYRNQGTSIILQATDKAGNESKAFSITVEASQRTAIRINRENLAEDNGIFLIKGGMRSVALSGAGYEDLRLTVSLFNEETGETTEEEIRCEGGEWQTVVKLPAIWKTAQITVDYSDGKTPDFSDRIALKYDGVCRLESDTGTLVETMTAFYFRAEEGAEIQATLNGTQELTIENIGEETYRIGLPALREGDVIRIAATDQAGNTASMERRVQLEERQAATVAMDAEIVNGQTAELTFLGTAMPDRPVKLQIGNSIIDNIPVDEYGNWSVTVQTEQLGLTDGTISYEIGYTDREAENSGSFLYDSRAELSVEEDGFAVNEDTDTIRGQAEMGSVVVLSVNGNETQKTTCTNGSFSFTGLGPFNAGDTLAITARDKAGNTAEASFTVEAVVRKTISTDAPTIIDGRVKAGPLAISGQATGGKTVRVTILKDQQQIAELTATPNAEGTWTVSDGGVTTEDGANYTINAEYADGKSTGSAASIHFMADGVCGIGGIPELITDLDASISGQTESGATVYFKVNGEETSSVSADNGGQFSITGFTLICDDQIEICAEDLLGNRSETVRRTVDTGREKLWYSIDQPKAGSTATEWVLTAGTVFSHQPIQAYYTLVSADGFSQETVTLTESDLGGTSDRSKAQAEAERMEAGLTERCSVRYMYELYNSRRINELTLPNGNYTYTLYATMDSDNEIYTLYTAEITLADPQKEEKPEAEKDYVNEYPNATPKFAAGLDEPVMDAFPRNEILMTGWIWAEEGAFEDPEVYYSLPDKKFEPTFSAEDIRGAGGSDDVVYRNIAKEGIELSGSYGTPDLEKAGFVLRIPMTDYLELEPGTYNIKVCVRDRKAMSDQDWKIGTYEITIQSGGTWDAAAKAEQIIAGWDDRPKDEPEK